MRDHSDADEATARPILVLKKKKVIRGGGHHGGAWKVAYADFVTAMMAFFLLMWLLNATTEDQRKGIADYFDPSVPISRTSGGGTSMFNGDSVFSEDNLAQNGRGGRGSEAQGAHTKRGGEGEDGPSAQLETPPDAEIDAEAAKTAALEALKSKITAAVTEAATSEELLRHLWMQITEAGLVIEIVDVKGDPLFKQGSSEPSERMVLLLQIVGEAVKLATNEIEIAGHTDARPFGPGSTYTNWELSADRAQAARRVFKAAGVDATRFVSIAGRADSDPAFADRFAPQNRRIEVTLLR